MSRSSNTLSQYYNALLKHAGGFASFWGTPSAADDGIVSFPDLPSALDQLQVRPEVKRKWMGGTCSMNLCFSRSVQNSSAGNLVFRGSRGGHFSVKKGNEWTNQLIDALNADPELTDLLIGLDLEALSIRLEEGVAETTLTPYGGGLAYLVLPPIRCPIPLPPEQIAPMAKALEMISQLIDQTNKAFK